MLDADLDLLSPFQHCGVPGVPHTHSAYPQHSQRWQAGANKIVIIRLWRDQDQTCPALILIMSGQMGTC
jgi:hypothetical protein